ncbi:MAG: LPS export ABC transporter ATP-binding protein [Gemmataceae bacterium]
MAILEVHGLVKYYKGRKVVDGVNFEVNLGEVVGLLGPNGAGKTTSFRMATGQITPNEGTVLFNAQDVTHLPMYRRARLGMGYLAQETSVFRKLSVEQNILAVLEALPRHRTLGRKLTRKERIDMTDKVLDRFGLAHIRKNNSARLSGGEKRRLEIARCLVCDPLLILLDEPFTGIDPPTIADIEDIIRTLRQQNIGILITDHQAREILKITDRIYLIHQGKVFIQGTPSEVASNEQAIRTYLGHTAEGLTFSDGTSGTPAAPVAARPPLRNFVEQDRVQTLLDRLRTPDYQQAAAELLQHGPAAIPSLVDALAWRDMEMRRRAFEVLQRLWPGVAFDPFAPEGDRLQQVAMLRQRVERRAG